MDYNLSINGSMQCSWASFIFLLSLLLEICYSGHEVLYNHNLRPDDVKADELLIVQFDSRPLSLDGYWNKSATWNQIYARKYHHHYVYLTMEASGGRGKASASCAYGSYPLAPAWCKVRAMVEADNTAKSSIKAFLYLDSDVIITVNYSMTHVLSYIKQNLQWSYDDRPIAFNQDGPGWACRLTVRLGFPYCFNSGTVLWTRSPISSKILNEWWHSVGEPYDSSRFPMKWRQRWPWEQAQMYTMHERYPDRIMRLSFPNLTHLPWQSTKNPKSQYPTDAVEPWCFSHWPGANCFITHYCASVNQKAKLMLLDYNWLGYPQVVIDSSVAVQTFRLPYYNS
jgi:hypothetical protein